MCIDFISSFFILFVPIVNFIIEILFHYALSSVDLILWCLLGLFMESVEQNHEIFFIEATKDTIDVATFFYSDFIQTFDTLNTTKIRDRYVLNRHNQQKHSIYFVAHFFRNGALEVLEILFICKELSYILSFLCHAIGICIAKITN